MATVTEEVWTPTFYRGEGERVQAFMEGWIIQTKGRWANRPLHLEDWERETIDELYLLQDREHDDELERVYREATIGIARKNGKSTLAAGIALYGLLASGENSPEVYAAAGSSDQARIVFGQAQKFIEASPRLQDWLRVYRSTIECKDNGGVFKVLSADGPLQHGLNPSCVVIDELWAHKDPELYYALTTGSGARENPLIVVITTAGFDRKSVAYDVYKHGEALALEGLGAMRRERFYHRWFAPSQAASIDDPDAWLEANPSSWIDLDELARVRRKIPPNIFRRLHMNQWTEVEDAWIAAHEYDACQGVVLWDPAQPSFVCCDIGVRRDSAAFLAGQWQGDQLHTQKRILLPENQPESWGISDIRASLFEWTQDLGNVQEIGYDPWSFRESAEILEERGLPMVEYPQNAARMAPASEQLYELILARRIVHDGDEEMRGQVLSAVAAATDRGGWRISKRKSKERIDACIALAMMSDRAVTLRIEKPQKRGVAFM